MPIFGNEERPPNIIADYRQLGHEAGRPCGIADIRQQRSQRTHAVSDLQAASPTNDNEASARPCMAAKSRRRFSATRFQQRHAGSGAVAEFRQQGPTRDPASATTRSRSRFLATKAATNQHRRRNRHPTPRQQPNKPYITSRTTIRSEARSIAASTAPTRSASRPIAPTARLIGSSSSPPSACARR